MPDETRKVILTQEEEDELRVSHGGAVGLWGPKDQPPVRHTMEGVVLHGTPKGRPLVHMHCWNTEEACPVELSGRVTLAGDEDAPLPVRVTHHFAEDHHQTLDVKPLDHTVRMETDLARPVHHALQMRTPLQVQFCNPWHVASDYTVEMTVGERRLVSIRLTGATVASPQPCPDDRCPEPVVHPFRP